MTKNTKKIIAALVVIVLLIVAIVVVLLLPDGDNDTSTSSAIDLISRDYIDVEEIIIENSYGSFDLLGYLTTVSSSSVEDADVSEDEDSDESEEESSSTSETTQIMLYTMQEYPYNMLDYTLTNQLAYYCANMTASKIVDKTGDRYADFGLDDPRATVTMTFSDSTVYTLYIGDDATGESDKVYVRFEGDKYVYLVAYERISMFLDDGLQLFDKSLSIELELDAYATALTLSGTYLDTPIEISESDSTTSLNGYMMYSPYRELIDEDTFKDYCEDTFFDLEADTVINADADDDDIEAYGLAEPYSEVYLESTCGSVHILTSEPDDDGQCYIMAYGETIVYQCDADDLPWLDITYKDFLSDYVVYPNMVYVEEMTVETADETFVFTLTHETTTNIDGEESISNQVSYDGDVLTYEYLSNYISDLSLITRTDDDPADATVGDLIISITFDYTTGDSDTFALYTSDDGTAVAVLNGIAETYADLEYAQTLASYVELLSENEEVPLETADEDSDDTEESDDE